jgi:antitoxin YefM
MPIGIPKSSVDNWLLPKIGCVDHRNAALARRFRACTSFLYIFRSNPMPTETTYTHARANFATLCDKVSRSREPVIIKRRGAADVALVDAAELRGLTETAHLLRSPKNAQRLMAAIVRARNQSQRPETIESLRREFELGQES